MTSPLSDDPRSLNFNGAAQGVLSDRNDLGVYRMTWSVRRSMMKKGQRQGQRQK